jgi:hypothetical protein
MIMKTTTLYISVFLILLVATSCETTEKIDDFPLRPSKLVVNSYFSADSSWAIQVSKSLSVLDNADLQMVNNASIDIFKNDELIDTIRGAGTEGWYHSDLLPEAGKHYSINVTTPDFSNIISAEDIAPEPVPISKVSFTLKDSSFYYSHHQGFIGEEYFSPVYGRVEGTFNITISDPAATENYYQLSLHSYNPYYDYEDSTIAYTEKRQISFTTNDPVAGDDDSNDAYRSDLLFSDDFFNGQNYQLKITIMDWDATLDKEYIIELLSLNKAGYLYRRSVEDYRNSKGDPFSEPVLIYSNIENGFGIFAGYAVDTYSHQLFIE